MKVLHAITRLDKGGSSTNTLLSAIGLRQRGCSVDILYGYTDDADINLIERAERHGVRLIMMKELVRHIHPVMDVTALFKIFFIIRKNKYDIVHAHSSKAGFLCRFAAKMAFAGKIIYTPHGHVFYGYFGNALTAVFIFIEKIMAYLTDSIVGLTMAECEEWLKFGIGDKSKYVVIHSGIDFEKLKEESEKGCGWREKLGIGNGVIIGSVGRFTAIKGYRYFIEAAICQIKKRKDVFFVLVGDGPLNKRFKDMVSAAGVECNFKIVPWQENIGAIIKSFDIFVLPSLNEGMGRVLIEAMFFSKPVIATKVGGVSSVIDAGSGLMVKAASSEEILKAVDLLLDDRDRAFKMGKKARERVINEYSLEKMVDDLYSLYMGK